MGPSLDVILWLILVCTGPIPCTSSTQAYQLCHGHSLYRKLIHKRTQVSWWFIVVTWINKMKVKTVYDSMHCYICSLNNRDCVCNLYTSRPVMYLEQKKRKRIKSENVSVIHYTNFVNFKESYNSEPLKMYILCTCVLKISPGPKLTDQSHLATDNYHPRPSWNNRTKHSKGSGSWHKNSRQAKNEWNDSENSHPAVCLQQDINLVCFPLNSR